jgi:alcohol dehydrogenase class IV
MQMLAAIREETANVGRRGEGVSDINSFDYGLYMAYVALSGGLALANSKLGAVHGIAGGKFVSSCIVSS